MKIAGNMKKKKNPKLPTVRAFGQRSIAPCFKISNPNPLEDSPENQPKKSERCASFTDFLDSKLNKSVLFKPKTTEEKSKPFFTSQASSKDLTQLFHGVGMENKASEEQKKSNGGLEKTMLQQFKPKETEKSEEVAEVIIGTESLEPLQQNTAEEIDHMIPSSTEINEDIIMNENKILKKRKDPFEGMESRNRTGKAVLILGDNLQVAKPKQVRRERRSINNNNNNNNNKKHKPNYNHYANGSGWWDGDMEGVDSEEVGHSEVWEGVGSTTFGDTVDWH